MNDEGFGQTFVEGKAGALQFCNEYMAASCVESIFTELVSLGFGTMDAFNALPNVMTRKNAIALATTYFPK